MNRSKYNNKKPKIINGLMASDKSKKDTSCAIDITDQYLVRGDMDKEDRMENSKSYLDVQDQNDELFHSASTTQTKERDFEFQSESDKADIITKHFDVSDVENEEFPLHKCVFINNHKILSYVLQNPLDKWHDINDEIARRDKHGNSALHLAVMLGRKECIQTLLEHNAPVKLKSGEGWTCLAEAISYGDRPVIFELLTKLRQQSHQHSESRPINMVRGLEEIRDFYMELKWDFSSWLPLVSRMLPSDVCRIHKSGCCLRLDTTLVDFSDMRWERGNISFIFRGDRPIHHSLTVLDNEHQCFQRMCCEEFDLEDEVDILMSTDILTANMSTKSVHFKRAQSGWLFREDRKELVGDQYECELYTVHGLILKQRKRREHLSKDDLQKNKTTVHNFTKGSRCSLSNCSNNSIDGTSNCNSMTSNVLRRSSLQPPPPPLVTWSQYINAEIGKCPQLGRTPIHKQSTKALRATVSMCKDFPLNVVMLLNILEIIAPFKHLKKLRDFVSLKLPPGFPVKVEIPVLHTVTAKITFQKFEFRENISASLFEVPENYVEDAKRFPDL